MPALLIVFLVFYFLHHLNHKLHQAQPISDLSHFKAAVPAVSHLQYQVSMRHLSAREATVAAVQTFMRLVKWSSQEVLALNFVKTFVVPRWWILMILGSPKSLTFSFSAAMWITFVCGVFLWKSLSNYWMDSWFSINFQILAVSRWCILMASDPASRWFT